LNSLTIEILPSAITGHRPGRSRPDDTRGDLI
jgi:hypothetical protein